eukprot:4114739-Pleurochrysis_carterae.AAC.1
MPRITKEGDQTSKRTRSSESGRSQKAEDSIEEDFEKADEEAEAHGGSGAGAAGAASGRGRAGRGRTRGRAR